jgi:hypothetical protein
MCIYDGLVNLGLHWHFPMAPSWHVQTKHDSIYMGDLEKPPRYENSSNCTPCRGAQSMNSEGESISQKLYLSHLKVC